MQINEFLAHFNDVKQTGPNQWQARCPSHDDRVSSLSITANSEGIAVFCHAGCRTEDVVRAAGLRMSDLFFDDRNESSRPRIAETYDYTDENGALLFQVVRYTPKGFRQRRPDGHGGWMWNLSGVRRVLYRLPELINADPDAVIFITEGEKDVDRLRGLGFVATTNPGGAGTGKWRAEYNKPLRGRDVVIVPDNDEPGRAHAEQVKESLTGIARSVTVLELSNLPAKGDVSDWLTAGHGKDELLALVKRARAYTDNTGPVQPATVTSTGDFEGPNLTDTGNAERLVHLHGNDMRYSFERKRWLVWDGKRWRWDESGQVFRWTKDVLKHLHAEASKADDSAVRKSLGSWANDSESQQHRRAMVTLAESEPGISIALSELDRDPWLLNVNNGTLDLRTGEIHPHRREDFISKLIPVDYSPDSAAPTWAAFLDRVMDGNTHLINFLQRSVGYSLTGRTGERALFVLYGVGANGKSTFLEAIRALAGDYGLRTPTETLLTRRGDGIPNDLARLRGARLVTASESEQGRYLAEARIKDLTGGDTISARFLHGEFFDFRPSCKIWLGTNHKPIVKGTDAAIWDRIKLIPFKVVIPPAERDHALLDKLLDELPAILAWGIQGALAWQEEGLGVPDEVNEAVSQYRDEMDVLGDFIAERCTVSKLFETPFKHLYTAYSDWCIQSGDKPISKRAFGLSLGERGFIKSKAHGQIVWKGIGLTPLGEDGEDEDENSVFSLNTRELKKSEKPSISSPSSPGRNVRAFAKSGLGDEGDFNRPPRDRIHDEQDLVPF